MMKLDPASPIPLHAQVEEQLLRRIREGDLPLGSRLPTEEELILQYTVSRTTVRTAVQSLIRRGMAEIHRGKGTFVTEPVMTQELTALTGFLEDGDPQGNVPAATVLDRRLVAASETVARQLRVQRGARVARIQRVRMGAAVPLSFDETYLPQASGATTMPDDAESPAFFAPLEQQHSTPPIEVEYRLAAVASHGTVARALSIEAGSPIFLIERTIFSGEHRPVRYERLYYRGDHIRLVTRLIRRRNPSAVQIGRRQPQA